MTYLELVRRQKGWSQTQLASLIGVHQTFISYFERQVAWPTPEQLKDLSRSLGVSTELLMQDVQDEAVADARRRAMAHGTTR
jgi:transcriptional regulator with XRE-family HTH domain